MMGAANPDLRFVPIPPPAPTFTPAQAAEKLCPIPVKYENGPRAGTVERINCAVEACPLWEWWLPPTSAFVGIGFCSMKKAFEKGER